ncbi:MAG: hypothetical protein OHK0046_28040 [Anaerolineae bacterium]
MKRVLTFLVGLALLVPLSVTVLAQNDEFPQTEGPIFEIAIRRIVDPENWATRTIALNELVAEQDGFIATGEYAAFFGLPEIAQDEIIGLGLSEWASLDAYMATGALLQDPTVISYFETIESIQNIVVQPFVLNEEITMDDLGEPGQVLEIAIRDISSYDDPVDFFRSIRGFTHQLTQLEGVIREFEWLSVDGQYFVGMTLYESMEIYLAAAQNEDLLSHPATQKIFTEYPPMLALMTLRSE